MEDKELDRLLAKLHDEIGRTQSLDENEREVLRHLDEDIRDLLQRSHAERGEVGPGMLGRLEDAIEDLEVTHPTLTELVSDLLNSLSNVGI